MEDWSQPGFCEGVGELLCALDFVPGGQGKPPDEQQSLPAQGHDRLVRLRYLDRNKGVRFQDHPPYGAADRLLL